MPFQILSMKRNQTSNPDCIDLRCHFTRYVPSCAALQIFQGEREVYRSDHFDDVESGTIKRKCRILDLKDYQELPKPVKPDVFYTRCFYAVGTSGFCCFYSGMLRAKY